MRALYYVRMAEQLAPQISGLKKDTLETVTAGTLAAGDM